jgi:RNA polymerase sigma factor (sigma-70 family)
MPTTDPLRDPEPLIRRVYAYVARRIGDGPDAEDVTSEVFERALRYRDTYDRERGKPILWLMGIARRCVDDALRTRLQDAAEPVERLDEERRDREGLEEDVVRRLELDRAIASLDARDRELIALRYGADLTARQIATLLEIRVNTAEVALHRAVGRLRLALAPREDAPARAPTR